MPVLCQGRHAMVREMRVLVKSVAILVLVSSGVLLAFGFFGALHPAGDSFAVFRIPLAVIFALCVIWTPWSPLFRWPLAALCIGILIQVLIPRWTQPVASDYDFVLYQQNMLFSRSEYADWKGAVSASAANVVTLQEVSGRNLTEIQAMKDEFPTQVYCPFATVGGVAVLSSWPAVTGSQTCADKDGLAAVKLATPYGEIWFVSIHLHWPWPFGQAAQIARLEPLLHGLDGHVVVAGDFNAVAWSDAVRRIENASGTQMIGPHRTTFHAKHAYPLGIDHVLSGSAYTQETHVMPKFGSDHHGIVAYLTRAKDR